jgi:hypothetical protein
MNIPICFRELNVLFIGSLAVSISVSIVFLLFNVVHVKCLERDYFMEISL